MKVNFHNHNRDKFELFSTDLFFHHLLGKIKNRKKIYSLITFVLLLLITIVLLFPIVWIYLTSFKTKSDAFAMPPLWLFEPTLNNYEQVFTYLPFFRYLLNSVVVAIGTTLLSLLLGSLSAYALTRYKFWGRNSIAKILLTSRMLPAIVTVVPLFLLFSKTDMLDKYPSLILTYTSYNIGLVTWMMIGFLAEVPKELEESAMIEGCTRFGAFIQIVLPLIAPGLSATSVFAFMASWNEFLYALIFMSKNLTLPVAIATNVTEVGVRWGEVSAISGMTILPVLIYTLLLGRYMVQGLTMGAVKG